MDGRHLASEASKPTESQDRGTAELRGRGDKVHFICPGCARTLKIRASYLGLKVACKRCAHQFVAEPVIGWQERAGRRPPDGYRHGGHPGGEELPLLVTRFDEAWQKIESLNVAASARDAERNGLESELASMASKLSAACERLEALGAEVEQTREMRDSLEERTSRTLISELTVRLAEERELAERRLGPMRVWIEEFRVKGGELAEANLAAERQSWACHERLDFLERTLPRSTEELEWIRCEIAGLRTAADDLATARRQLDSLREECLLHLEVSAARGEGVREELEALYARQGSLENRVAEQADRQARVESEVLKLEEDGQRHRRALEVQWEQFEAQSLARWQAIGDIHERLLATGTHQDARLGQLEAYLERIEALEADASNFRIGLETTLVDQRRMLEGELRAAGLLGGIVTGQDAKSINPSAGYLGISRGRSQIAVTTLDNIEQLVSEMANEQAGVAETRGLSGVSVKCSEGPRLDAPAVTRPQPENLHRTDASRQIEDAMKNFDSLMRSFRFSEAAAVARALVSLTSRGDSDPDLTHALWLRNLGLSLSMAGELVEARISFHAALEICGPGAGSAWSPRVVCLLDLAEFHLHLKDVSEALRFCEMALAMLDESTIPADAFRSRARRCLERIKEVEGPMSLPFGIRPEATIAILA